MNYQYKRGSTYNSNITNGYKKEKKPAKLKQEKKKQGTTQKEQT
jgi:hypothetical protein